MYVYKLGRLIFTHVQQTLCPHYAMPALDYASIIIHYSPSLMEPSVVSVWFIQYFWWGRFS